MKPASFTEYLELSSDEKFKLWGEEMKLKSKVEYVERLIAGLEKTVVESISDNQTELTKEELRKLIYEHAGRLVGK